MSKSEKQFQGMLAVAGLELVAQRRIKHLVIRVRLPGRLTQRSMSIGYTPSDYRVHRNNLAQMKRISRELQTLP